MSKINKLNKIALFHSEWVATAKSLGAKDYAEDLIQEAYIKIDKYNYQDKIVKDNKIQRGYMFFIIRSLFINYVKAKSKIKKLDLDPLMYKSEIKDGHHGVMYGRIDFDLTSDDNLKEEIAITSGQKRKKSLKEEIAFGKLCNKMDKELNNLHWYDKRIFEIYRDTPLSIRGIAKETDISFVNIFHTLKKVKTIMKDKFSEDYQDYIYGDYDRI